VNIEKVFKNSQTDLYGTHFRAFIDNF